MPECQNYGRLSGLLSPGKSAEIIGFSLIGQKWDYLNRPRPLDITAVQGGPLSRMWQRYSISYRNSLQDGYLQSTNHIANVAM